VLQTGEIVEIITSSSSKGPSRDWLTMVTTGEARSKIRAWFKKEMRQENIEVGRAEVERELRRLGRAYTESELMTVAENLSRRIGITGAEDLFNTLGFGGLSISRISGKLKDEFERVVKPPETVPAVEVDPSRVVANPKSVRRGSGVVVDGQRGCQVKFARCCNPLPGDEIIGFVSRGFGISVHKRDCPNAVLGTQDSYQKDRWLPAAWEEESEMGAGGLYEAMLMIEMEERIGVLAEITAVIADMKVSILQINTVNTDGRTAVTLTVGCKNVSHYNSIVARLRGIPSVLSISRGYKGAER
jgi:GTP pyrophosphokinase